MATTISSQNYFFGGAMFTDLFIKKNRLEFRLASTLLLILFCVSNATAFQSTFSLIGSVRNQSGQSVSGVRVSVIDENFQPIFSVFVDTGGRFTLKGLHQGKFTVRIETTGTPYEEYSQPLELQTLRRLGGNEDMIVDIVLKYKKGEGPPPRSSSVFAQEVPKAAQKEMERATKDLKSNYSELGIASLKKAIEAFPDYFAALELLGLEYLKIGQYDLAVQSLTRATVVNKRASRSMYGLGVAFMKLSQLPEATEWLLKSDQIDPKNPNTSMMLGLAYGNSGDLAKSEAAFRKSLQLGGEAAAEAHYYLTGLYNKQERYREAWQELELFIKEAKNVKEPSQIKAMIASLKEKEKAKANQEAVTSIPAAATDATLTPAAVTSSKEPSETPANAPTTEPKPAASTLAPVPSLPPEYLELLQETDANGIALHKRILDYTYKLKKVHRVLNASGNSVHSEEQVFEAYPIHGEHVLITLSRNGVQSRTISDERKRAAKLLEEAELKRHSNKPEEKPSSLEPDGYVSAGVTGVYAGKTGYVSINVSTILRSCEFFSPRIERISDRNMVVLNYRYRPGFKLATNHAYIVGLVGTVWIDQSDKVLTRLEGWPSSAAAFDLVQSTAPRDEAALVYQQVRQPDGTWVPNLIRMNAGGRTDLFDGLNWDVIFEFSNYQHFNTQADDAKIKNPIKTP